MALHDYRCPACGAVCEQNVPVTVGASNHPVWCLHAGQRVRMQPVPAMRLSLFSDADPRAGSHDFAKATIQVEDPRGGFRTARVSALGDIRRLERESEQAERNGEGRRMVWRDYSQAGSNRDQHTLGEDPSMKPAKTFTNGQPVGVRRGAPVTTDHGEAEE